MIETIKVIHYIIFIIHLKTFTYLQCEIPLLKVKICFIKGLFSVFDAKLLKFNRPSFINEEIVLRKLLLISLIKTSGFLSTSLDRNNLNYDVKFFDSNEIQVIKDLNKNYKGQYSWFFIIHESTLFFPFQVVELVANIEHDIFFGREESKSTRCSVKSGILISKSVVAKSCHDAMFYNIVEKLNNNISFCKESINSNFTINECMKLLFNEECRSKIKLQRHKVKHNIYEIFEE
ncbi:hypothetical protein BpHYR1_047139 [Brachionus plicatilis]|uniref:Uncharacterized protein n=1 Tax=Brachionus plicatilis TaxID=10195 RepID=A0A3M7PEZ1_BRAPC|nr:hypothetical protein BpHYR1_047139 [Brachionus plicatilis]